MEELLRAEDFDGLAFLCEQEELKSEGCVASPEVYGTLLAVYLLQNELDHAKLLWQRIPKQLKSEHLELGQLWEIGKRLWRREFPAVYELVGNPTWPDHIQPMVSNLVVKLRERLLLLVGRAYRNIRASDLCSLLGKSEQEVNQIASDRDWDYDVTSCTFKPKPIQVYQGGAEVEEDRLQKLTDIISFLEN